LKIPLNLTPQTPVIQNAKTSGPTMAITAAGPAQGISYYQVYAVGSSNAGWEYPAPTAASTTLNHGGALLRVVTLQYGLGNYNPARLNATIGTHYSRAVLCGPFTALYYCNVGDTITGYFDYFSFDGMQGGFYSSSASSVVAPFGTWTDTISIQ
jgi:hypothetical protein